MGWGGFAAVFAAFFVTHSLPIRPPVKGWLVQRIGAHGFAAAYSVLSLGMLGLLIWAANVAPYVQLWPQMPWQRHAVQAGMLTVCVIVALALGRPNPLSFGGADNDRFDPARPGIVRWLRHPVLVALGLWAGLHLLPNGDLAHVLLFGVLALFAVFGRRLIDRRKRRTLGAQEWTRLTRAIRAAPLLHAPASWPGLILRLALAVAVYGALIRLHPVVIGVPVL